jgi:hypothetical protein
MQMTRLSLLEIPAANAFEVAPHRYLFSGGPDRPEGFKAVRNAAPYQTGDVIYVVHGSGFARAYVHRVWAEPDSLGDYRECYDVRRETKTGSFAKTFYRVHPGQVQRGYQRAGLAPDVPA